MWGMLVVMLACGIGLGVTADASPEMLVAVVVAGCFAVGLNNWRTSVYGLLIFLPYSGLLIIATYPSTGLATLAKDAGFVLPIYLGLAGSRLLRRPQTAGIPGFPLGLVCVLAGVVALQLLNPTLPSLLVGLIGAKVWVMYIPMAYVGYHLITTKADVQKTLFVMSAAAMIPLLVGLVEGVLVNTGRGDLVYSWYGGAADAVTQGFAIVGSGGASIKRVPSTFSFVTQYYLFTVVMIAVSYGYWRGFLIRSRHRAAVGALLFMLVILSAMLSGARGAILAVPAMVLVMLALDGVTLRIGLWLPIAAVIALAIASAVFGTTPVALVGQVLSHGIAELTLNTVDGFRNAFDHTLFGLGPGVDTVAARYGLSDLDPFRLVGGSVSESWWVKSVLELGVVGMAVVVSLMATVSARVLAAHRSLTDPQLRSVSSGLMALVAFVVFYNLKGSYLDFDPTNVLFWLSVGILLKLPELDRRETRRAQRPSGQPLPSVTLKQSDAHA